MQRIDSSGSVNGQFTDGNPALGQLATAVSAKFLNDLQEEICTVILENNIALSGASQSQLYNAIVNMIENAIGAIDFPVPAEGDPIDFSGFVPVSRQIIAAGLVTGGGDLLNNRTLTVTAATPEQAQAGVLNTVALTPLSAVGAGRVLTTALNIPLLGGGILKAGATTILGNSSKTITFPTAFPSDCVYANVAGGVTAAGAQDNNPTATGWSASAMTAFSALDGSATIRWFAIGY